ncbi:hypothetical protein TTHERM_000075699 (macronuclear) [Tetrahymena thermophila SB210]|uniref:Uncharacterized protein n=1 Tax=Tetrahymena thermophila (strain SB210) TaxID=312017 RepID=W7XI95_TETTS|nr:hypothetical protein TTHERM_000075699 [Tetrahymena thermophila SB210]EWS74431.1 hypothetical protein TTHERM_000075699 [Tetrahymena thermophila SB210]|eukprot:XP_012653008.1 hypothetical protein TTHERM_000075699 [Tetrahymena thermophila SB210]
MIWIQNFSVSQCTVINSTNRIQPNLINFISKYMLNLLHQNRCVFQSSFQSNNSTIAGFITLTSLCKCFFKKHLTQQINFFYRISSNVIEFSWFPRIKHFNSEQVKLYLFDIMLNVAAIILSVRSEPRRPPVNHFDVLMNLFTKYLSLSSSLITLPFLAKPQMILTSVQVPPNQVRSLPS